MESTSKQKTTKKIFSGFWWAEFYIFVGVFLLTLVSCFTVLPYFSPKPKFNSLQIKNNNISEYPQSITIDNVTNKLPVILGDFHDDSWDLATNSALLYKSAGKIGKNGNVVIYGHNTNPIFGALWKAKKDQMITLHTNSQKDFHYKIDSIKKVNPTDVSILSQTANTERITIFTCTGLFDSQRLVVSGVKI